MGAVVTQPSANVARAAADGSATDGSFSRLLRFAVANIKRRPERFVLSTLGIALAVMAVVVVRTIAGGFASAGSASFDDVLRGDRLWVVGPDGFRYEPALRALVPQGDAAALLVPDGWTATRTLGATTVIGGHRVVLYGRDDVATGTAVLGRAAAAELGVGAGDPLTVAGTALVVDVAGEATTVTVNTAVAGPITGARGWWTLDPPSQLADRTDLGAVLGRATGLPSTTDPARTATPGDPATSNGLIYDTQGGSSLITFQQKLSALFTGRVTGSALGLVSTVGLVLGFVIAVSSFLAAVQERRREFGIMSSIGLADEVLYFFLVESALVFLVAYTLGALAAGAAVALVVPGITTLSGWLSSAATVGAYLPAMAIVGALIPVHRLVQQRPVDLLRESA